MKTFDVTFIDKNNKNDIIIIRVDANGKEKAKQNAIKNFKYSHKDININNIDINIKQVIVEDEYL